MEVSDSSQHRDMFSEDSLLTKYSQVLIFEQETTSKYSQNRQVLLINYHYLVVKPEADTES